MSTEDGKPSTPVPAHCYFAEFDDYPDTIGTVEVRETVLVVTVDDKQRAVLELARDQWGTFYSIGGVCVAQEDGTRSFLDALIGGLQAVRDKWDIDTKDATKKHTPLTDSPDFAQSPS